ncbi:MAG TPA: hypothetical protein VGE26_04885 [Sphingobacteriaceae bacterium]
MTQHDDKSKRNHTGQSPSDIPTEKLIKGPDKERPKKEDKRSDHNSTGKDPNLGTRDPILR